MKTEKDLNNTNKNIERIAHLGVEAVLGITIVGLILSLHKLTLQRERYREEMKKINEEKVKDSKIPIINKFSTHNPVEHSVIASQNQQENPAKKEETQKVTGDSRSVSVVVQGSQGRAFRQIGFAQPSNAIA